MDKAPDAYRTISEVGEDLDIAQHVLRFWETRFPQIKPLKRGGGRRYYRPDDVELLKGIRHLLYKEGYTIKGVQRILREQGPRGVISVGRAGSLGALAGDAFPLAAETELPASHQSPAVKAHARSYAPPEPQPALLPQVDADEAQQHVVMPPEPVQPPLAPMGGAAHVAFTRGGVNRAEIAAQITENGVDRRGKLRSALGELEACRALIAAYQRRHG